jgi:hypothetical protein
MWIEIGGLLPQDKGGLMRLFRVSLLLSLALLVMIAACSPAPTAAPPTVAPTQSAPTETSTPLIAATIEVTAEATTAAEATLAATAESTAAATEAGLISTREATAEADSTAESTASAQVFMLRQTGFPAGCAITPNADPGVNIRSAPTRNSELLGGLLTGSWVVASGVNETGTWFQISAPGTPVDGGWITRQNVKLRTGCTCIRGGLCQQEGTPVPTRQEATAEATP